MLSFTRILTIGCSQRGRPAKRCPIVANVKATVSARAREMICNPIAPSSVVAAVDLRCILGIPIAGA
jgi:hypothetical protein